MITCLAIDDEPLALQQLSRYIQRVPFLDLKAQCQSALEAREVMKREAIDAIFIDINMPDLNGMDFVRSMPIPPIVVFTTAYSEYAIEGYKVDAVDYLLKPFGLEELQRAALKVKERYELKQAASAATETKDGDDTIFVKSDYSVVPVKLGDIAYIEGMSEYLKIHLEGQKPLVVLLSMKKMEERLPAHFMRIHRSYIVNLDKIRQVNKNRIVVGSDTWLPVGDLYREAFNNYISQRILGK